MEKIQYKVKSEGPELPPMTSVEVQDLLKDPAQGQYMRHLWVSILNLAIHDTLGRDSETSREFFKIPLRRDLREILGNVGVDENYFLTRFLPVLFRAWEMQDATGKFPRGVIMQENYAMLRKAQSELGL